MKKKYAASLFALVLGMLVLVGCAGEFEIPFLRQDSGQTVTGEVCRIKTDSIILRTEGTADTEEQGSQDASAPEFSGEEQEVRLTKDTVFRLRTPDENRKPETESEPESGEDVPDRSGGGSNGSTEEAPEKFVGEEISAADLSEGDVVSASLDKKGNALEILVLSQAKRHRTGKLREAEDYDAAAEFAVDMETDGQTYASTGTDENAVHVYGEARVTMKNTEITRTSRDSTGGSPAGNYGVGAALLTTNGISCIRDSIIRTDASGGAGIFSYGNACVYAMDTEIFTKQGTSGGLHTAGGGKLYAWNLNVETSGSSSSALDSGQGGGTMVVDGGAYRSVGADSPAVSCRADMAVREAVLAAEASEAVRVEGGNSLHLYDCELTGNMGDDLYNDSAWNVLLYQGMSGDTEQGNCTFEMKGGRLTAHNGGIFYTTNTESTITLSNVKIEYPQVRDFFLKCTGNDHQDGWGKGGANGADCLFTADSQDMEGDILWDDISQLDLYMTKNSTLTGAVLHDKDPAGKERNGYCNVYIEEGCTWTVTGDSTLTRLSCSGRILDDEGKPVTIRGTDGTVYVQGAGKYTITVVTHEAAANLSGASEMARWTDYEVQPPESFLQ